MILIKTVIFTILVPGTVTVVAPYYLLSSKTVLFPFHLGEFRYGGAVFIVLGACVYGRCAWDFAITGRGTPAPIDAPEKLVVRGFYRFVRNPMYVGVLMLLGGEAFLFEAGILVVYALMWFVIFHVFVVFFEEPTLRRKFGESYDRYCDNVPRWIPLIMGFNNTG